MKLQKKFIVTTFIATIVLTISALSIDARAVSNKICPTPLPQQYQHLDAGEMLSAYVANWDVYGPNKYNIENIEPIAHRLTHIIYAFMKPDEMTGVCRPHDNWADIGAVDDYQTKVGGNFAKLLELKKKHPHLKILLSIGGGTYNKNFIKIAQNQKMLMQFAKSCVEMLDFYHHDFQHFQDKSWQKTHFKYHGLFDGLDIDWEWDAGALTPALSESFSKFIHELRRLLQIRKKATKQESLLAIALQATPSIYKTLNLTALAQDVDWFHLMAYDFFGPGNETIGFNAPICSTWSVYSIDGALQRIMEQGLSPEKMVLGLPLYGYMYENTDGYNAKIDKKSKSKHVSYNNIQKNYLDHPEFEKQWDEFGLVPSLYNSKKRVFISYDGHESMAHKVEFAKDKKMRGVVLWRLSGDDDKNTMVHAIADALSS